MKKSILLLILLLFVSAAGVKAQFNSSRQDYKPEELKKIFKKKSKEYNDYIFDETQVPDKWKNESVVILARKVNFKSHVNPFTNIGYIHSYYRVRMKLQDQSAVEKFSQFYFGANDIVEIKVESPDGTVTEVDMNDAIDEKETVSDFLFFSELSFTKRKKLAIPNLSPGDIIDYTAFEGERFNRNVYHWSDILLFWFPLVYLKPIIGGGDEPSVPQSSQCLADDYPVVAQKIEFDLSKNFYLNFRSLNGAPDIEVEKKKKGKGKIWVFTDTMREKLKEENWSEPMYSLPSIKYKVSYLRHRHKRRTHELIDRKKRLKTSTTEDDIKKMAREIITNNGDYYRNLDVRKQGNYSEGMLYYKFYKTIGKKINSDAEFLKSFFNYYREEKLLHIASEGDEAPYNAYVANRKFVNVFVRVLKKRLIPYKLIMGVPRSRGGMEELMNQNDVIWGVKVDVNGEELIFIDCDIYSHPNQYHPALEGLEVYEIKPSWYRKGVKIDKMDMPISNPTDNNYIQTITAEFTPGLDTVKMQRITTLTGMQKYRFKDEAFDYGKFYDRVKKARKDNNVLVNRFVYETDLAEDESFLNDEEERLKNSFVKSVDKNRGKKSKAELKSDYYVTDYNNFKVVQDGLDPEAPEVMIEEKFDIRDMLDDLGNNTFILKVGEFIDGQVEIKDMDDRERETDIIYPYPRSFVYNVEIQIPAGLKVGSIEHLNRNVDNETGSFRSVATLEMSVLKIKIEKKYKDNFHEKSKWSSVLAFVDEAVDFRSAKVILTR